jgi:hypothetical protein
MSSEASVIVGAASAFSSAAANNTITGTITNFKQSGGDQNTQAIPVFGGGNIDREEARNQIEVSFDVIPTYGLNGTVFDGFVMGSSLWSSSEGSDKVIYVQFTDGSNFHTRAYNNARAVSFSPSSDAGDFLKGTITFKLSPTNSSGQPNLKVFQAAASTVGWP